MNDSFKIVEDLSARARREKPPMVDVSMHVVSRLGREVPVPTWPMALFASSAAVAAVAVLNLSYPFFQMLTDPWSAFFVMAANVLP
jgi:hypothetical protein